MAKAAKTYKKKKSYKKKKVHSLRFMKAPKGPELKTYDEVNTLSPTSVVTGASGIVTLVGGMAQGVGENTFLGNSITLKSILMTIGVGLTGGASTTRLRCALVIDTQPAGAAGTVPVFNDIFLLQNIAGTSYQSPMNLQGSRGRFKIIWDKFYDLGNVGGLLSIREVKKYLKMNIPITFNTVPAPNHTDLLFVSLSDQAVNAPSLVLQTRLRFIDN